MIDENALTRGLRAGEIAGAGLDVFERGRQLNPRLRELPNVVLLPHMGSATREGRAEMGEKVIINIKTFADGHPPARSGPAIHAVAREGIGPMPRDPFGWHGRQMPAGGSLPRCRSYQR